MLEGGLLSRSTPPEVFGSRHSWRYGPKQSLRAMGGWAEALGNIRPGGASGGMGPGSARLTRDGKKRSLIIYRLGLRLQASLPRPQAPQLNRKVIHRSTVLLPAPIHCRKVGERAEPKARQQALAHQRFPSAWMSEDTPATSIRRMSRILAPGGYRTPVARKARLSTHCQAGVIDRTRKEAHPCGWQYWDRCCCFSAVHKAGLNG